MTETLNLQRPWKLKVLLLCHLLIAFLFGTLFWPFTATYWEVVDVAFFKLVNGSLKDHPLWQIFWALANHKMADWVEDLFILGFFIAYVRSKKKEERKRSVAELIFLVLLIAFIIFFVNRVLFRQYLSIPRESPTLLIENSIRLSHEIPWLSIKDGASKSFPGDHGTTALLFGAGFSIFARGRLRILAIAYAIFLCLPRLFTGAHWFSDILVGSGSIALFFLSWAFCTPIHIKIIDGIEWFFNFCISSKKKAVNALQRKIKDTP